MDYYSKADRVIGNLLRGGAKAKFIIYPLGERGMLVKQILNEVYGIEEEYIVDNRKAEISKNKKIITIEQLKNINLKDTVILLTSDREDIYSELRCCLMGVVDLKQVVDIFSYSAYFDQGIFGDNIVDFPDVRIAALCASAREIYFYNVEGAVAECGVYMGAFARYIARFLPDRKFYLFDTFEGFPEKAITAQEKQESSLISSSESFKDTSVEIAMNNIGHHVNTIVRKGFFPETAQGLEDERFAFVSLDMDLYIPILAGLEFFYPRMNPGGYIYIHDFRGGLPGVRRAVEEFCKKENIGIVVLPDDCGTAVLSKSL